MELRPEKIERLHAEMVLAGTGVAAVISWPAAAGLLLGGTVMGADFWLTRRIFRNILTTRSVRRPAVLIGLALFKLSLFLGLLGLLFWHLPVDGLGFGFGVTLLLVACVVEALRSQTSAEQEGN